jgi:hypothetical protein
MMMPRAISVKEIRQERQTALCFDSPQKAWTNMHHRQLVAPQSLGQNANNGWLIVRFGEALL